MSTSAAFTRRIILPDHSPDDKVVLPGGSRFDDARRAWNLASHPIPPAAR